ACLAITSERSAWAWRASAPTSTAPPFSEIPLRPSRPLISINRLGDDSRILSVAIRLCPPASNLASFSPSNATASSSDRTFLYANGAGFTCLPRFFLIVTGKAGRSMRTVPSKFKEASAYSGAAPSPRAHTQASQRAFSRCRSHGVARFQTPQACGTVREATASHYQDLPGADPAEMDDSGTRS